MVKLIASDLDGTLLHPGSGDLAPRTIELIKQLTQKGIRFVAASGRQYHSMEYMFRELKDEVSFVAENGSLLIDHDQVLFRGNIHPDLAHRILTELKSQDSFSIALSREEGIYIENGNSEFAEHLRNEVHNKVIETENLLDITEGVLKIAICSSLDGTHIVDKYQKHLRDIFGNEINVVTSGNIWIDFIAPNTNKAVALSKLLDHLHIDPRDCIAFGDQYNDVEMLQFVGHSYAMSTAAPGISYYSTYVTNCVDEVLQDILDELDIES